MSNGQLYLQDTVAKELSRIILITGTLKERVNDRLIDRTTPVIQWDASLLAGTKTSVVVLSGYVIATGDHMLPSPFSQVFPQTLLKEWKMIRPCDLPLYLWMPKKTALFEKILSQQYKRLDYSK
jgi:hypothetical protein